MALHNRNIEEIERILADFKSYTKDFSSVMEGCKSDLANDTNYQLFVEGSERGRELNEKLERLIALLTGLRDNEMESIITLCTSLVEVQKALNMDGRQ